MRTEILEADVHTIERLTVGVPVRSNVTSTLLAEVPKLAPVIVILVPPDVLPVFELMPVMYGAAVAYVKFVELLAPLVVLTYT